MINVKLLGIPFASNKDPSHAVALRDANADSYTLCGVSAAAVNCQSPCSIKGTNRRNARSYIDSSYAVVVNNRITLNLLRFVAFAFILIGSFVIHAVNNPVETPEGFEWVVFSDLSARFLKPVGWHSSTHQGKLMASLVIQEPTSSDQSVSHARFTVNVVTNLSKTNYRLVSEQLKRYAEDLSSPQIDVIANDSISFGKYTGVSLLISTKDSNFTRQMSHRIYLANDTQDWLVILNFQSSEHHWQSVQTIRKAMMSSFELN